MAGRPVKTRTPKDYDGEILSLQRLRTAILIGRSARSHARAQIEVSDKAVVLIDGLVECLLELRDHAQRNE